MSLKIRHKLICNPIWVAGFYGYGTLNRRPSDKLEIEFSHSSVSVSFSSVKRATVAIRGENLKTRLERRRGCSGICLPEAPAPYGEADLFWGRKVLYLRGATGCSKNQYGSDNKLSGNHDIAS